MTAIASLLLSNARPDDQAHLLLWDTPNSIELNQIILYNGAQHVNYRENLLQRTEPSAKFLTLHHQVEEEFDAIRAICEQSVKPIVLLEGLDCFITYLNTQPGGDHITLFWNTLEQTRKLQSLLWILLPHKLAPTTWKTRVQKIPAQPLVTR
jgi:hypothetical protein